MPVLVLVLELELGRVYSAAIQSGTRRAAASCWPIRFACWPTCCPAWVWREHRHRESQVGQVVLDMQTPKSTMPTPTL